MANPSIAADDAASVANDRGASRGGSALADERLRSLFTYNYDAILTLDAQGRCLDANVAAETVFGCGRDTLFDRGYRSRALGAFYPGGDSYPATFDGATFEFSNEIRHVDGRSVEIDWRIVPIVVNGRTDGAYLVGRDVSGVRSTAGMLAQQTRRTHALYLMAATHEKTCAKQIDAALHLLLDALDVESGYVAQHEGEDLVIRNVGGEAFVAVGDRIALHTSLARYALAGDDVRAYDDLVDACALYDARALVTDWHGYLVAPLVVDGQTYGVVGLATRAVRTFEASDLDFVRLASALIAAALERHLQNERLDRLAFSDTLTGLANRTKILQDIESAISHAARHGRSLAIHSIDLDGFKAINDRAGHATGDLALCEVAERLRRAGRGYDVPARFGGDEFLFLQCDLERSEHARALGARIVAALSEPYHLGDETFDLGASLGIAVYPTDGHDARTLLNNADLALYRAKANGKRRLETSSRT